MLPPPPCVAAFVTAPGLDVARTIVEAVLAKRVAACANIVPQIESHYWWQGKLEQSAEALIIFKTTSAACEALRDCVLANHPYDTPEFVALPIEAGSDAYLAWIRSSVANL